MQTTKHFRFHSGEYWAKYNRHMKCGTMTYFKVEIAMSGQIYHITLFIISISA
jgi:hypothetical protein